MYFCNIPLGYFYQPSVIGYPFPIDFPNKAISGLIPNFLCIPPKVSLNPEVHSSKIKTIFFLSASFLIFLMKIGLVSLFLVTSNFIAARLCFCVSLSICSKLLFSKVKTVFNSLVSFVLTLKR